MHRNRMSAIMAAALLLLTNVAVLGAEIPQTVTTRSGQTFHLGLKRDPEKLAAFKSSLHKFQLTRADEQIPAALDLSPDVSLPENQGSCGSCWAYGLTKGLRSAHMLAGNKTDRLGFLYLIANCGPVHEYGCGGGDFEAGNNFLQSRGPWLESDEPDTRKDGNATCLNKVAATATTMVTVGPGNRPPTFQELATALAHRHELVVDVAVCGAWGNYQGGILSRNDCGANSINHIVNMNGYDCETSVDGQGHCVFNADGSTKNHDGYLWVMNNWGESGWGEVNPHNGHGGYMRTRYGVDAIADTAVYFEVESQNGPSCDLVATPTTVQAGQQTTLTLQTQYAVSAAIDGQPVTVPSATLSVAKGDAGTYSPVATVTGPGGKTATCTTTYTVTAKPTPPAPAEPFPMWLVHVLLILGSVTVGVIVGRVTKHA